MKVITNHPKGKLNVDYCFPTHSCDILLKTTNVNFMLLQGKSQLIAQESRIHPLWEP